MRIRGVVFLLLAVLVACAAPASRTDTPPSQRRFVALVPSLAEDLYAIGAGDRVVGVSQYSDVAPRNVPRVADFQSVATERIVALHPDVVVGIPSQDRLLEPLRRAGINVQLLPDDTYDDIFTDLRTLGELSGQTTAAHDEIAKLQAQTGRFQLLAQTFHRHPSVFFALGTGPIWTAGPSSYIGHLISLAGGTDAAQMREPWGQYSEEALLRAQPDAIVNANEVRLSAVLDREPWRSLRAVREGHVFTITDQSIANALYRPGPRYNEGLRWLIERLKPLAQ